jgi:hypothetical protein
LIFVNGFADVNERLEGTSLGDLLQAGRQLELLQQNQTWTQHDAPPTVSYLYNIGSDSGLCSFSAAVIA